LMNCLFCVIIQTDYVNEKILRKQKDNQKPKGRIEVKKVIIIGCPGSGKSTFGRKLMSISGLTLHHLDMMYWNADRTTVPKEVFTENLQKILENQEWIIDGNYTSTMEMRIKECDTVFFLDYPTRVCIDGIKSRKGQVRSDMPWVEDDNEDQDFINFVLGYNTKTRPVVLELLKKYSLKNIIVFSSREESEEFLLGLKNF